MKDENTQRDEKDTVFRSYRERIYFRQLFHSMLLCIILFFSIEWRGRLVFLFLFILFIHIYTKHRAHISSLIMRYMESLFAISRLLYK